MDQPKLLIVGADGATGRETARLAVAYGAEVYGLVADGSPPVDEPWIHGVTWLSEWGDERQADAVVILDWKQWGDGDRFDPTDRIVLVDPPTAAATLMSDRSVITVRPGEVHDEPIETMAQAEPKKGIRVERLAMALLRAALDIDIPDHLGPDELQELGDAVFLQGIHRRDPPA